MNLNLKNVLIVGGAVASFIGGVAASTYLAKKWSVATKPEQTPAQPEQSIEALIEQRQRAEKRVIYAEFIDYFENIEEQISFKPEWLTDTGKLGYFVIDEQAIPGDVGVAVKFVDATGRKAIGFSTRFGNVVVHEATSSEMRLAVSAADEIGLLMQLDTEVDARMLEQLFGFSYDASSNLGRKLEGVMMQAQVAAESQEPHLHIVS